MKTAELMTELESRYPRAPLKAWVADYATVLSPFEGSTLRAAFSRVLGDWQDSTPPRPAHFKNACLELTTAPKDADGLSPFMRSLKERDQKRINRARSIQDHLLAKHGPLIRGDAEQEGWSHLLVIHLNYMARELAKAEVDFGKSHGEALRWANACRRPFDARNPHDPDKVFSQPDILAWKIMGPQQRRVSAGWRAQSRDSGRVTPLRAMPTGNTKPRPIPSDQILDRLTPEQCRELERSWENRANFVEPVAA